MDLQVQHQAFLTLGYPSSARHGGPGRDHYFLAGMHLVPSLCHMEKQISKREGASWSHCIAPCWKPAPDKPMEFA